MAHVTKFATTIAFIAATISLAGAAVAQRAAPGTGGSLPLAELMAAAAKYPNLIQQVRLQLLAAGLKKEQVTCSAERFSNQWEHLGGARLGPYDCPIGKRVLRVTTTATYFDRNGHRVKADDPALRAKAKRVAEGGFKWTWK